MKISIKFLSKLWNERGPQKREARASDIFRGGGQREPWTKKDDKYLKWTTNIYNTLFTID